MILDEQLKRSGQWLFERRSYLPLVLVVVLAPAMASFEYPGGSHRLDVAWELICLAISLTGLMVRVLVVGFVPNGTSGRNTREGQVAVSLNTTGLYSIVRHPLYLANYLIWLGVMLFPRAWWCPVIASLAFWLYYERIVLAEEAFLRARFGGEWDAWAKRTPTFIPSLRGWQGPARPFSFRRVLRAEYSALFGVVAMMTTLEVIGDLLVHGRLELEPLWIVLFGIAAGIYVLLRTVKHRTSLLGCLALGTLLGTAPAASAQIWKGWSVRQSDAVFLGSAFGTTLFASLLDKDIASEATELRNEGIFMNRVADVGTAMGSLHPIFFSAGMYGVGRVIRQPELANLGKWGVQALVVGTATTRVVKGVIGRQRPNDARGDPDHYRIGHGFSDRRYAAFPSGHATSAFAVAAVLDFGTEGTPPLVHRTVTILGYGAATVIGVSRVYDNEHWASDVLGGAAVGIASGMIAVRRGRALALGAVRTGAFERHLSRTSLTPRPGGGMTIQYSLR